MFGIPKVGINLMRNTNISLSDTLQPGATWYSDDMAVKKVSKPGRHIAA